MIRLVPHDIKYREVSHIARASETLLYISGIIAVAIILVDNGLIDYPSNKKESYLTLFNSVLAILALLYFVFDVFENYRFLQAEEHRRKDFIDNSLEVHLADENSTGYFSNESLSKGAFKMGVNCFENALFTKVVLDKMKTKASIKSIIVIVIYLILALFTTHKVFAAALQITLPLIVLQKTIRLFLFSARIHQLFEQFKLTFDAAAPAKRDEILIFLTLQYDSTLSWGGILLDGSIFNKINPDTSLKWENLKTKYHIC